jgi:hypothetical protein
MFLGYTESKCDKSRKLNKMSKYEIIKGVGGKDQKEEYTDMA